MSVANDLPSLRELRESRRSRYSGPHVLAAVLLEVLDAMCEDSTEYAELRDRVKPLLDEVIHGR